MAKKTTHILNASANLLGFCLFVITSLHIANLTESHFIDKITSGVAVFLTVSCFCSYISIRTKNPKRELRMEIIADYFFVASLLGILTTIILIAGNIL